MAWRLVPKIPKHPEAFRNGRSRPLPPQAQHTTGHNPIAVMAAQYFLGLAIVGIVLMATAGDALMSERR